MSNYLPPKLIAEIGCNHKGNFDIAKDLIKIASNCNVDVVKFQKRNSKELLTKKQYDAPHPNPIHSYCFFPETSNIKLVNNNKSFGVDSVVDFFIKNDYTWINFGAPIDTGFTIFHHLERIASVPYRKKIEFNRNLLTTGKIKKVCFEYFARKDNNFLQNFYPAVKYLIKTKTLNEINVNGKSIYFGSSKKIIDAILNKLIKDPFFLMINK